MRGSRNLLHVCVHCAVIIKTHPIHIVNTEAGHIEQSVEIEVGSQAGFSREVPYLLAVDVDSQHVPLHAAVLKPESTLLACLHPIRAAVTAMFPITLD